MAAVPFFGNVSTLLLLVVGFVFVLVFAAVAYWFGGRRASDAGGIDDTGADRQQAAQEDTSVGFRTHALNYPTEGKAAALGALAIFAVIAYEGYSFARTGGPTGLFQNPWVRVGLVVAVAAPVGLVVERKRSQHDGKLVATVEADTENGTSEQEITVHIDRRDISEAPDARQHRSDPVVDASDTGSRVAYEYTSTRVLGLFRRARRIAEDRALRDDPQLSRPVDDKIGYEVPPWAVKVDDATWHFRTRGRVKSTTPETEPDYVWLPPESMSAKEREQLKTDNRNLRDKLREKKVRIASMSEELEAKDRELQLARADAFDYVVDRMEDLQPLLNGNMTENQIMEVIEQGHTSRDADDVLSNGDSTEAES